MYIDSLWPHERSKYERELYEALIEGIKARLDEYIGWINEDGEKLHNVKLIKRLINRLPEEERHEYTQKLKETIANYREKKLLEAHSWMWEGKD